MKWLLDAISNTLYGLYPTKPIYMENIEQNFTKGTFFIDVLASTDDRNYGHTRYRSYSYDVMYYPVSDTEPKIECINMGEVLREAFERVTYNGKTLKGEDRSTRIVDDVLHMTVTFRNVVTDRSYCSPNPPITPDDTMTRETVSITVGSD